MSVVSNIENPTLSLYTNGRNAPTEFTLTQSLTTIGRQTVNTIHFNLRSVSRYHACIEYTKEGYVLVDLESANGTFVNLQQIPPKIPYKLQVGDVVHVGQLEAGAPRFVYHGKRCRRF